MAYNPLGDIEAESKRQSDAFKQGLPNLKQNLYEGAANQSRSNLAGQMDQIKRQASGRGLLYGGIRTGLEQQAQGAASGQLAQQQYNINKDLEDQQNNLQRGILNNALERYRGDVSASEKYYQQELGRYNLHQQQQGQLFGGLLQGGGIAAAAFSDRELKTNISDGSEAAQELLDNIKPHKYDYKDPLLGEGKHLSPMAQDLEKSEAGKAAVTNTPIGKIVDYGKLGGVMLAAQAALNERLKKLEAK